MKKFNWKLLAILLVAAVVRFGGLTWAFPYHPHPDEWNMAAAVVGLNWQEKLNPHFFAYGQFPLYLTYFSATLYNQIPWINLKQINIQEAIFFLRFWSAVAGVATVYLVYLISRRLLTAYCSLLTAALAAFTPGLIQISHFGTTESLLSFFFLLVMLLSFKILEKPKLKYYLLAGGVLGLAIGTKISALVFGSPIFLVFLIQVATTLKSKNKIKNLTVLLSKFLVLLILLVLLVLLSSPYLILAFEQSRSTLLYETSIAAGNTTVFYTRQFIDTIPVLFQVQKIFPYALGWPIFILGTLGILLSIMELIKKRNSKHFTFYILHFTFWSYFLFQAFLFTKWTRFMSPIFAFFSIFAVLFLQKISEIIKNQKLYIVNCTLYIFLSVTLGLLFASVYFLPDIRFTASEWVFNNIPSNSQILFDTGNVVDVPVSRPNYLITNYSITSISFDFYNLDENSILFPQLINHLSTADFIIVPSRRIFANHLRFPYKFPLTAKYYELLFSGKLGFTEITKIQPLYSKIFDDEKAEETFSVFDHPTIRIYKKTVKLSPNDYEKLFK